MYRMFFLYLFFLSGFLYGQELPPLRNFAPYEIGAENQNWEISQSDERLIYIANNSGLLEYNGASWRLFPSPNETIIRSVMVAGDRIYMGCFREFGFWEKNEYGNLDYFSLSKKIENKLLVDEEFWSITLVEGKVFFQSKKRIYSYDLKNDSFDFLSLESSLPRIFNTDLGIFTHSGNEGLFQILEGNKVLTSNDDVLRGDEVINVFSNNDELLLVTRHRGLYKIIGERLLKWNISADSSLNNNSVYSAIQLSDQRIVLGTVSNGILILDSDGNIEQGISQVNGLRNNTVLSIYEDFDNNIWLGLDNGISIINIDSPYKVYNDREGAIGSVYAATQTDDYLYLGTNQGLYYKGVDTKEEFRLVSGTQGQVWSLNLIGDTLFCGHHSGTFVISDNEAVRIADIPGTWKIGKIDGRADILLQGNYDGLYVLHLRRGRWMIRNKIEGFDNSSRYFEVLDEKIFVNHEYKGVFEINTDSSFSKVNHMQVDSFEPGFNSSITKFSDNIFYAHKRGVLIFDEEQGRFSLDSTLSNVYPEDSYVSGKMVVDDKNDCLWFFSKDYISKVYRGKLNESFVVENLPIDKSIREGVDGYESISYLQDEKYLLGTSAGYIILDLKKMKDKDFEVQIESVNQMSRTQLGHLENYIKIDEEQQFGFDENNLRFSFYTTSYDKFNTPKYQFQLSEIYPDWSEWSNKSSVTFENLPYGEYVFNVRSSVGNTFSDNVASYSFKIGKPWHLSNAAILIYVLLMITGSFLIHSAYRKYYRKRQNKLIAQNKRQMELAKAQNEKEIIRIKNEQLQKEFRSKSNELAASTLSIIRKNELLTKVKEELMSNTANQDFVKPIVNIIDKSLKKNDDWELFKEAFNNADRKFLKKLKKAHPQLTPNDIRLCAYLRLNLSSKEIAPLFNISPRSVEIKRYRLRKKMDLSHDDNLTDYILKL